jgi:hypothetical protein
MDIGKIVQLTHEIEGCSLFFSTVNSAGDELSFRIEGEENSVKRLLGCVMIAAMPEEGVEEALQSLKDILEFWQHPAQRMLPSPPTIHYMTAKVLSISERPDLVLSE